MHGAKQKQNKSLLALQLRVETGGKLWSKENYFELFHQTIQKQKRSKR